MIDPRDVLDDDAIPKIGSALKVGGMIAHTRSVRRDGVEGFAVTIHYEPAPESPRVGLISTLLRTIFGRAKPDVAAETLSVLEEIRDLLAKIERHTFRGGR